MNDNNSLKRLKEQKELFHNKHEIFTEKAFNNPKLLPDRYIFTLTNLCNLKCTFCFQKKDFRKDAMTTKNWINTVKQLPDYARVTFCGGEPLISPGFKEIFSFTAKKFNCNIISNGILLTEELIDHILSFPKFKVLSLSIDNIGNTIRGITLEQWEHLKKMIEYFQKRKKELNPGCTLDIKTIVLDETAEYLFKIYKYLREELDADTHVFQFLKGSPIQHADYMFNFKNITEKSQAPVYKKFDIIKEQLELVRQYNLKNNKVSFVHPKIASLTSKHPLPDIDYINDTNHIKERFLPCRFPWSTVHINVDGTIFPCLAVSMGNVKEKLLHKIINGENLTKFKNTIKNEGTVEACNRCGWIRPKEL